MEVWRAQKPRRKWPINVDNFEPLMNADMDKIKSWELRVQARILNDLQDPETDTWLIAREGIGLHLPKSGDIRIPLAVKTASLRVARCIDNNTPLSELWMATISFFFK